MTHTNHQLKALKELQSGTGEEKAFPEETFQTTLEYFKVIIK